jgi:threonine aldolase
MLVGTADDIARGRLYRKRLGGGMRQAGILAAAGLIALEEMPKRLCEDHENAAYLAKALGGIAGIRVTHRVETNIVIFDVTGAGLGAAEISARLKARGVLINPVNAGLMRAVTHMDVNREQCEQAIGMLEAAVAA